MCNAVGGQPWPPRFQTLTDYLKRSFIPFHSKSLGPTGRVGEWKCGFRVRFGGIECFGPATVLLSTPRSNGAPRTLPQPPALPPIASTSTAAILRARIPTRPRSSNWSGNPPSRLQGNRTTQPADFRIREPAALATCTSASPNRHRTNATSQSETRTHLPEIMNERQVAEFRNQGLREDLVFFAQPLGCTRCPNRRSKWRIRSTGKPSVSYFFDALLPITH